MPAGVTYMSLQEETCVTADNVVLAVVALVAVVVVAVIIINYYV